jgi:hypothetical protein
MSQSLSKPKMSVGFLSDESECARAWRSLIFVLELDGQPMQRRRHEVSDEGVGLAVEAPPELPHPHEHDSGAQPLPHHRM